AAMALPVHAARHAGLRRHADPRADRLRRGTKAGRRREPQRLLLRAGPADGRIPAREAVRQGDVGEGDRQEGPPCREFGSGADDRRQRRDLAGRGRRPQLDVAQLSPGHEAPLLQRARRAALVLQERRARIQARRGVLRRWRRRRRQVPSRRELGQARRIGARDRRDQVGAPHSRAAVGRRALDRGQSRVFRDARRKLLCARRAHRQGALALRRRRSRLRQPDRFSQPRPPDRDAADWRQPDRVRDRLMRAAPLTAIGWTVCVLALPAQNTGRQTRPQSPNVPETNPYSSPADVAMGRVLYAGRCGHCHGQNGEGGRGVPLNTGRFRHGGSDRELFAAIRYGVPDTEMPGSFILQESEIWRMVAYVQQLGRQGAPETSTGDAAAGAAVYARNACAQCHTIGGQGGFLGPDLTDIGSRRALRHLRQSIVDPSADIPLDYRSVIVTDAGGTAITGIHLNEDEYSIHLRDLNGNLRSFLKREIKDISLPRRSLMPAYPLPPAELENLVAYLASLKPARVAQPGSQPDAEVWTFDRLTDIGGHPTTVLGDPKVIDTPVGKAVEFDGIDDALFVDCHPLAGAAAFTWEAVFRPDGGQREQRWFHLNESPATGADTENRMLFEIRVVDGMWYLDSYTQSGAASKALMNREARHPLGAWYHVASVYDGRQFRNYVDGVREGSADIQFAPQGPGRASIGVRINKVSYFKGAVSLARFTRRALLPYEFLSVQRHGAIDRNARAPILSPVSPADHHRVDRR